MKKEREKKKKEKWISDLSTDKKSVLIPHQRLQIPFLPEL
jgi:hypothetical protein